MKHKFTYLIILMLSAALSGCIDEGHEIYVSPDGNDSANGELSTPVASLQRAATLAREKTGKVPVTIFLSGGDYRLTGPLELNTQDGGTAEAPVSWKSMPGETPVISGGVPVRNWVQEDDDSWSARLPADFNGKFRSLYINGKRATRARFPDHGYLKVHQAGDDNRTNFFFRENDFPQVKDIAGTELVFLHDWTITRIGVKSIDWKNNQLFTVDSIGARSSIFAIVWWNDHPHYRLENAREFCDSPGEWYCDFDERKIFYYPLPGEIISETEGVIPVSTKLITIAGNKGEHARFISFEEITFEHTAWQLPEKGYCGVQATMFADRTKGIQEDGRSMVPAAIELDLAESCGINNCTVRHTGGSGIWIRENCSECEISENHLYDISGNGVNIGEGSDRLVDGEPWWKSAPEEVSKNNKVTHSLIEDCGNQFYGAIGIWGGLVSNTIIDHNEVRNLPYTGISVGWMWNPQSTPCRENTINANHVHHVMQTLNDGGCVYCLGLQPDSRITNNLFHDVPTHNKGSVVNNGIFMDEGTQKLLIENNIIYNIEVSPVRFHKAFQNIVRNNVFVCGEDVPPIYYIKTEEEDIKKIDNIILDQSSEADLEKLAEIIKKRKADIGPGRYLAERSDD